MMQVIMGRQVESLVENIKQINISHQEVDRILKALEEMYSETKANAPAMEWMPVTAVGNLLCHELGYVNCIPSRTLVFDCGCYDVGLPFSVQANVICVPHGMHPVASGMPIPTRRGLHSDFGMLTRSCCCFMSSARSCRSGDPSSCAPTGVLLHDHTRPRHLAEPTMCPHSSGGQSVLFQITYILLSLVRVSSCPTPPVQKRSPCTV